MTYRERRHQGTVMTPLSERELATVLAALRKFQALSHEDRNAMPQFDEFLALGDLEIDALCERLNVEQVTA